MKVVFARIDERLMHGIVLTQYLPSSNAQRIMVIDDVVATIPAKKEAMQMAKPAGYASSIITLDTAINNIKANKYGDQRIFLLTKSPVTVLKLVEEAGVKVPELVLGSTELLDAGTKLSSRCFITDEELDACRKLAAHGTKLTVQHAISVPAVDMWKIVSK